MTMTELAEFDGREGRAAYVVVSGSIYDVSASPRWNAGNHEGVHQAGQDLTEALKSAPHVRAVIERFPVIGRLEELPAVKSGKKLPLAVIVGMALLLLILAALFI